ncbi:amino acid adenylation [Penicillium hordei]|uniref:Amino acid adenylation n=1 Tax=Penicillium hordei TaxID=40994 RepID=A0AAD6E139_9EURO|nr:amino acid adenylation [Penicillium hordei]KAJ5598081.1 amino acid adenylation [Penicillium hordei]
MPESMKFQIPPLDLWMDEERGNGHQNQQEEHYPDPCFFPSLSKQATGSGGWLRSRTQVPVILGVQMVQLCQSIDVTIPAVLLGAWGLVLRAYTGTDAVCFGYVEPVADTSQSDSAVLRSPCFLDMTEDLAPTHLVKQAQNEWMRLRETRPCSSNSCGQSNNISSAAQFNTSLAFVSPTSTGTIRALSVTEGWTRDAPDQDGLLLEIDMQSAEVVLFYGNSMLTADQAIGVLDAFCVAVAGVTDDKNPTIRGLSLLGDRDRERIYGWNAVIPEPASQCIHELIEARCKLQPERPAVNAWDGNFTYQQLSRLSAELAAKLVTKGVGREVFVPICLEKSRWVVVAMLGVMKAGAAMVLLDVSHPPARLQQICREVSSQVVLTSPESATMARTLARQVVVLGYGEHERGKLASEIEIPSVKAENALYAVFTSGSTGSPKGVIIEHATFHSSVQPYTQALLLDRESRVFQFASYAFDVIIFDTLIALIVGGCVCIPSDTDRWSDVARTIERFQVNHVSITPTVARLLNPQEVPTLKTLALGGEQLSATDVARWTDHVHVINLYGASECPIISLQRKTQDARSTGDDNGTESHVAILAEPTNEFRSQSERSRHHMQEALPPYMVPAIFLPLRTLPLTRTSKTDRRRLRELAGALTRKELEQFQPEPTRQRPPITEMEKVVQRYYADILHIPQVKVGADDHFFHRGGDSVTAMALVASARKNHHKITVKDIFDHPRLWEIALIMQSGSDWTESLPQRFSLLGPVELQHVITTAAAQCSIDPNAIEDIYPCTPLQEGLVALSVQDSGPSFVTKISLAVPADLELERLQHAWNKVAEANPILRTRIIVSDLHGMLQVVVREHIAWDMHLTTAQVPEYPAVLGDSLVQFAISPVEGRPDAIYQLVIHMHHAVYDGWTLPLLLDDLKAAYNELSLPIRPFTPFIRYLARMQGQEAYWKSVMTGIHGAVFPSLPLTTCHPTPRTAISIRTTINPPADRDFTANTYISLAWALTQGQIQDSHDVFFGAVRSGRNSSVPGIETMTGPTIASVPSRIIFNPADLVRYALQKIQKDMTDGIPFEQTGLQNIRRFGPDAARACSFQTLLVVQPERRGGDSSLLPEMTSTTDHYAWVTYCLTLICNLEADALHIEAVFDDHVVPEKQMQGILTQFIRILHQLHANTLVPIANLLSLAPDTASWSGQLEDGTTFWKEELGEREGLPTFPRLPSISYVPSVDQRLEYCFTTSLDSQTPPDATETMLLAAWGILQARFLASSETVFGAALDNSRVVPFKVRIDQELAVEDYLVAIRNRFHKFLYHRSDGFEAIARLGNVPAPACGFESLLMMRRDCKTTCRNSELQSLNKALVIEIASDSDSTIVQALFDSNVISTQVVTRMLQQFEHVALQLSKKRAIAMKEVELATPRDKEDIYRWNGTIDRRSNTTVHSLIQRQIENHPKDQAICSWDGDMTYEQLDRVSTKLAGYLMDFGIDTETYIPICFEKSLWSIVAMLAVMKAGAAFVPLDPSAPESRLQTMIEAVQATTMLSSKAQHDRHPRPLSLINPGNA